MCDVYNMNSANIVLFGIICMHEPRCTGIYNVLMCGTQLAMYILLISVLYICTHVRTVCK